MAKAREIPAFADARSFRAAAAMVVEVRTEEVFEMRANVLDTSDIERVHDMRVATRRLRAAMEIFAPCFPRKRFRRALRDVKDLADVLGERRDPDVAIAAFERIGAALPEADRPGVESLVGEQRARQEAANVRLAAAIEWIERERLRERLLALVAEALAA